MIQWLMIVNFGIVNVVTTISLMFVAMIVSLIATRVALSELSRQQNER